MAAKIATSIGLAFDIIGVFILWRYGLPEALIRGGFGCVNR